MQHQITTILSPSPK